MKKYYIIISCLISLSGMASEEPFTPTRWEIELNRLDDIIAKEYKKKYDLNLEASGGGGISGFWQYSPHLKRYCPASKIEARQLAIEIAEDLLKKVNTNQVLVEGMISYPFTPKNLGYAIFFHKKTGDFVDVGQVRWVEVHGPKVIYSFQTEQLPSRIIEKPLEQELKEAGATREEFPRLWAYVDELNAKKLKME